MIDKLIQCLICLNHRSSIPSSSTNILIQNRYDLLKVEVNQLYTRLLVKLPPAPKMEKKKKSWIDSAGGSIKNVVDGAFKNMAGVVADKVIQIIG